MTDQVETKAIEIVNLGTIKATGPQDIVNRGVDLADRLANIINTKQLYTIISRKKYVNVEGWNTLGAMIGILPREVSVTEHENGDFEEGDLSNWTTAGLGGTGPWNDDIWNGNGEGSRVGTVADNALKSSNFILGDYVGWLMFSGSEDRGIDIYRVSDDALLYSFTDTTGEGPLTATSPYFIDTSADKGDEVYLVTQTCNWDRRIAYDDFHTFDDGFEFLFNTTSCLTVDLLGLWLHGWCNFRVVQTHQTNTRVFYASSICFFVFPYSVGNIFSFFIKGFREDVGYLFCRCRLIVVDDVVMCDFYCFVRTTSQRHCDTWRLLLIKYVTKLVLSCTAQIHIDLAVAEVSCR